MGSVFLYQRLSFYGIRSVFLYQILPFQIKDLKIKKFRDKYYFAYFLITNFSYVMRFN